MSKVKVLQFRAGMTGSILLLGLLVVVPLITCAATAAAPPALAKPIVIMLSWDGLRHDYPDIGEFPGMARLQREGVRATRLRTGWPSTTFPGHVNIATGTYPDRHGIVDNRFFDRERGVYSYSADANWLQAEPLWIAAERQGVKAATYFWVGSETDWHGQSQSYRIAPFDGGRLEALKVDQILAWLGLSEDKRPQLIMSYWAGADDIGHHYGPESLRLNGQLQDQDYQLQRLLRGIDELALWPLTTLILVSDHGMTVASKRIDLVGRLQQQGIDARVFGDVVTQIFVDDENQRASAGELVQQIIAQQCPDARLFPGALLPREMRLQHPSRTGDWVAVATPPCVFSQPTGLSGIFQRALDYLGWGFGSHGYDPDLPDMGGVFMAMGRGVDPNLELGEVRQIDVAATVSELLDMEPPQSSEGQPIW